jgi:hypothetical protein
MFLPWTFEHVSLPCRLSPSEASRKFQNDLRQSEFFLSDAKDDRHCCVRRSGEHFDSYPPDVFVAITPADSGCVVDVTMAMTRAPRFAMCLCGGLGLYGIVHLMLVLWAGPPLHVGFMVLWLGVLALTVYVNAIRPFKRETAKARAFLRGVFVPEDLAGVARRAG